MRCILVLLLALLSQYASVAPLRGYFSVRPDCNLPCQFGIVLGQTTVDEASEILPKHEWFADVLDGPITSYEEDIYYLSLMTHFKWTLSGQQPGWLKTIIFHAHWIQDGIPLLQTMRISTSLTIGDTLLMLGLPNQGNVLPIVTSTHLRYGDWCHSSLYQATYSTRGIRVLAYVLDPLSLKSFWNTPVDIEFYPTGDAGEQDIRYDLEPIDHRYCASNMP